MARYRDSTTAVALPTEIPNNTEIQKSKVKMTNQNAKILEGGGPNP
jgi:hypothetical protein